KVHLFGSSLGQVGSYLYLGGPPGVGVGSPLAIIETPHSPKIAAQAKAKIFPFAFIRLPPVGGAVNSRRPAAKSSGLRLSPAGGQDTAGARRHRPCRLHSSR